uniref:THAP-type domain-containing protein n=1 Tax=Neogobius melanostomus TaxID=47308 RepID=A0A8C6SC82_9GOBI
MVNTCSAVGCTNRRRKESDIKFHRFPSCKTRRKQWLTAMKRMRLDNPSKPWEPKYFDRICSVHFIGGKPSDDPGSPSYIPSIFSFTSQAKQSRRVEDRYERLIKRRTPAPVEPINENVQLAADALLDLQNAPLFCDRGTDPDPDPLEANLRALGVQYAELQDEHKGLQAEYQRLLSENQELRENVRKGRFTYTNLNNEQMRNLTGLKSCALFLWVLSLISMFIKPVGKICPGDQLLLVLMKLRLSLTNADLAIRFKICPTIVSKIFSKCLPVISQNLKFLIEWPSKVK